MRSFVPPFAALLLLALAAPPVPAQTQTQTQPPAPGQKASPPPDFSYRSGGRRDPFKDLLQGQSVRGEKKVITGLADLAIDDVVLMGIIKAGGKIEAIVSLPQGFPLPLRVGDKLADGFVVSIEETQVVFRKTRDASGLPLLKPKDVIKDIISEEP